MNNDKYGIVEVSSTYIEADERSRKNPGHGYPASWEEHTNLREYPDRESWEYAINKLANPSYGSPKPFRAIIFREVEVTHEIKVNIG